MTLNRNGNVIDSGKYRKPKTFEPWHAAIIANPDNNSKPPAKLYAMLLHKNTVCIQSRSLLPATFDL